MGLLTMGAGASLTFLPALETLSLHWPRLSRLDVKAFYLVLLCLVLSCLTVVSWKTPLFSETEVEWILGERGVGGAKLGEGGGNFDCYVLYERRI